MLKGCFAAFSPDGARLTIASHLSYVRAQDAATLREEATPRGLPNAVGSMELSPNGDVHWHSER